MSKNLAEDLAAKPDKDLLAALAVLPEASRRSQSEVVHQRACKDGSVLYVTSRQGGPVRYDARAWLPQPPLPPIPAAAITVGT